MTYREPVTVMYVDEAEPERRKTHQRLAKLGYNTLSTSGGAEALAAIQKKSGSVTLVLIRTGMKQMPEAYLARAIALQWPQIPVLFVSEMSVANLRAASKGSRGHETYNEANVVVLPFTDRDLQTMIHGLVPGPSS